MLKNEDFNEEPKVINPTEWYKHASPFGNTCIKLTLKDIMSLLSGKDLFYPNGEYSTFIRFVDDIPLCKELLEIKSPSGATDGICSCYHEEERAVCTLSPHGTWSQSQQTVGVCWGTKEREECSCGGDKTKCNFYPEKMEAANNDENNR